MIVVENVSKNYGKNAVLKNITFSIPPAESVAFLGANGCGKTTLIEIISGVLKPTMGKVIFKDKDDNKIKFKIGVQFQEGYWPVGTTPMVLIKFYKGKKYVETQEAQELIDTFEIRDLLTKDISSLSGGQRQRFNCFLSILNDPEILVLDELITGLDLKMQIKLTNFLKNWKNKKEVNLLIASHIPEEVEMLCDRVILLKNGEIYDDKKVPDIIAEFGTLRKMLTEYFINEG